MPTGKELKRLRGKLITAAEVAALIGVGVDRYRKWEERDTDPNDTGDIEKVEKYFGVPLQGLKDLKFFDFVQTPDKNQDFRDRLISSLEREKKLLERENERLNRDLDLSLGEVRHNLLLSRAIAETNQNLLIELLAKQRKVRPDELAVEVGKENGEKYKSMKEEGSFAYVGK